MTAQFNEYERLNKDRFSTWRKYSITARGRFEVLADYCPWTQDHRMDGVPKLPRLLELLDLGYITEEKKVQRLQRNAERDRKRRRNSRSEPSSPHAEPEPEQNLEKDLYADISQGTQRNSVRKGIGCLHTNAWVYSYEKDVVLPSMTYTRLHGYPTNLDWSCFGDDPATVANAARILMGSSYSLPSAAHAIAPAVLTLRAPWWESSTTKQDSS